MASISVAERSCRGSTRAVILDARWLQGSGRGDLFVHMDVRVPSKLTREQRKLFEQLRETLPEENEPHDKGILDKVKDYFM